MVRGNWIAADTGCHVTSDGEGWVSAYIVGHARCALALKVASRFPWFTVHVLFPNSYL
jgi:hypothetical protein